MTTCHCKAENGRQRGTEEKKKRQPNECTGKQLSSHSAHLLAVLLYSSRRSVSAASAVALEPAFCLLPCFRQRRLTTFSSPGTVSASFSATGDVGGCSQGRLLAHYIWNILPKHSALLVCVVVCAPVQAAASTVFNQLMLSPPIFLVVC